MKVVVSTTSPCGPYYVHSTRYDHKYKYKVKFSGYVCILVVLPYFRFLDTPRVAKLPSLLRHSEQAKLPRLFV